MGCGGFPRMRCGTMRCTASIPTADPCVVEGRIHHDAHPILTPIHPLDPPTRAALADCPLVEIVHFHDCLRGEVQLFAAGTVKLRCVDEQRCVQAGG